MNDRTEDQIKAEVLAARNDEEVLDIVRDLVVQLNIAADRLERFVDLRTEVLGRPPQE